MGNLQNVKKIVITGFKGYIGKKLVQELRQEKKIKLILFKENLLEKKSIQILNKFHDCILLHLAGYVPKNVKDYETPKNKKNIEIFENILKSNIKNIYLISTYAIFGNNNVINEKIPNKKKKLNTYSKSKLIIEKIALKSKKKVVILRVPGIFGYPRKSGLIYNTIIKLLKNKEPHINKNLPQIIVMHLRTIVTILVHLLKKDINLPKQKIININYKRNININNIIRFIFEKMNKKPVKINYKKIKLYNNNFTNLFENKVSIEDDLLFEINFLKKKLKKFN